MFPLVFVHNCTFCTKVMKSDQNRFPGSSAHPGEDLSVKKAVAIFHCAQNNEHIQSHRFKATPYSIRHRRLKWRLQSLSTIAIVELRFAKTFRQKQKKHQMFGASDLKRQADYARACLVH